MIRIKGDHFLGDCIFERRTANLALHMSPLTENEPTSGSHRNVISFHLLAYLSDDVRTYTLLFIFFWSLYNEEEVYFILYFKCFLSTFFIPSRNYLILFFNLNFFLISIDSCFLLLFFLIFLFLLPISKYSAYLLLI